MTVVLEVRDLVKRHSPARAISMRRQTRMVTAVDGVSLSLREGETLGLVGESGCGKSTLARMLTAVDRPTSGEITVLGTRLDLLRDRALRAARRDIQLIFQDPYTCLDPRMTAGEIVREPLVIHRGLTPRGNHHSRVGELLELVRLSPDHAGRRPHEFSGGQRQRIGIARALALRPKILVCDEPVSALDVSVQAQIVNLFTSLQHELGVAYVFHRPRPCCRGARRRPRRRHAGRPHRRTGDGSRGIRKSPTFLYTDAVEGLPHPRPHAAPTKQSVGADGSSPGAQTLPIRDLTHITQREATGQEAAVPPVRRGR